MQKGFCCVSAKTVGRLKPIFKSGVQHSHGTNIVVTRKAIAEVRMMFKRVGCVQHCGSQQ